ncbi:MAG: methyltransferase domain-containing protein [Anaerolineae bacterium]|nr:MAG: methyltransferase domain-containing protein [Anaerolineae bacterium]
MSSTSTSTSASASANGHLGVCGDALALPFPTGSIDLVACSLLAHHFPADPLRTLLRELDRVARHRVVVVDLRRSWVAAAGIWLASFPLGFHPISRHDGRVSVLRAFTPAELRRHITDATGAHATVTKRAGYRLLATWCPAATVHTPATTT